MSQDMPRQRILVVEDSVLTIRLLADLLSDMAEICFVTDSRQVLKQVKIIKPALILLDVEMPQSDGYEVGRQLKLDKTTEEIPFIFITARADSESEERGLEIGAVDYIYKPILPAVVRARVKHQLQLHFMTEQLKQANAELLQLASRDPLTDVFNRRHFMDQANRAYAVSRRNAEPLSLIMIDVDHFKQVNDQYGHDAGDRALIHLVTICDDCLREVDSLGRFGGEEFAILLPGASTAGAQRVAERLRQRIAANSIPSESGPFSITVSIGISQLNHENDSMHLLIKRADDALYRAKQEGRNCTVVLPTE